MVKKRKAEQAFKTISLEGYLTKKPKPKAVVTGIGNAGLAGECTELEVSKRSTSKKASLPVTTKPVGDPRFFKARQALPLWGYQEIIREVLRKQDVLLLTGETGSGKSTQVPQFLMQEDWCQRRVMRIDSNGRSEEMGVGGVIAVTQPRRVAATTLARRVSREAGTPLHASKGGYAKGLVGYSVRFDYMVPRGMKIKYLTEGMLLQELLRDPHLRQYSAVVVDEIHERSVDVDLLCGFLKQIVTGDKKGRGGVPLKMVVMSATANVKTIRDFFASPVEDGQRAEVQYLHVEGRQFLVQITHTPEPVPNVQDALLKTICKIHTGEPLPGDILAFLSGQEEIETVQKLMEEYALTLASNFPRIKVLPLFGQLSIEAQQEAFQPIKGEFVRKIVLATNIAETSVTVSGVRYVVDCGKAKVKQFRSKLGMESLLAKPISKSSAIQRTGRAGREAPGKCYRLYTEDTYRELEEVERPEILRTDVSSAVLTMKSMGIEDIARFPMMDLPDEAAIHRSLVFLHVLGAVGDDGSITDTGRKMMTLPVTAPYAKVILTAADPQYDCLLEVIDIISCITAGDAIFHQLHSEEAREETEQSRKNLYRREGDLVTYLTTMQQYAAEKSGANQTNWCRKRRINMRTMHRAWNIRKQLRGLCLKKKMFSKDAPPPPDPHPFTPTSSDKAASILKSFLRGFAIKTAMIAPDSSYETTAYGKHLVAIHPSSVLHGQKLEAIMFLEHVYTTKNYVKKVSSIQAHWIPEALEEGL